MTYLPNLETRRRTISDVSTQIIDLATKNERTFFFAGAGISARSGLPSWTAFISNCVQNAFGKNASVKDIASIHNVENHSVWLVEAAAQEAEKSGGPKKRNKLLHRSLWGDKPETVSPKPTHYLLVQAARLLDAPIFTINYDDLLEAAAKEMGIECESIVTGKQFRNLLRRKEKKVGFCIIHLHGLIPKRRTGKGTIVASEFDYYNEFNRNNSRVELLKRLLSKRRGIFLGTSLSDININRCLLATSHSNAGNHLWLTQLNGDTMYARNLHGEYWQTLRIKPVYCSHDYREVPAILRRVSEQIQHATGGIPDSHLPALRRRLDLVFRDFEKTAIFQKCINPLDQYELDYYVDCSDEFALTMKRVWTSRRVDGSRPGARVFKLDWRCHQVLQHSHETAVPDAIDSVSPHYLVRSEELYSDNASEASGVHAPFRSWAFVSIPIFEPKLGRALGLFVLKYVNKDNWLATQVESIGFTREVSDNIYQLSVALETPLEKFLKINVRGK